MLLATYVHDIDPFVFRFPGWLSWLPAEGVRWYGLSYLVGFVIAGVLMRRITAVGRTTVKPFNVADMIVAMAIGVVLGGRLGYVIFYDPTLLTRTFDSFPYWDVFAFNQGGMASHGGIDIASTARLAILLGPHTTGQRNRPNHARACCDHLPSVDC